MAGKARPSLRKKTLENVMLSNLSKTDKECIKAVFDEVDGIVRCKECKDYEYGECVCQYKAMSDGAHYYPDEDDFCNYGERRSDG